MSTSHAHHHAQGAHSSGGSQAPLVGACVLTWGYAAVEAIGGWQANSLALLADAGHMVTDGASLALALLAAWLATRPPSPKHTYGLGRAELLAALVNALAMLAVVVGIGFEAWRRFQSPSPVAGALVGSVAAIGLLVNIGVAWILSRGERNLNMRGALLHVLGDALGSVAAICAGVVVMLTGWTPIDPLLSLLICGLVLTASLRLLRDALHGLLDGVPAHLSLPQFGAELASVPGVIEVHDLHVWSLSGDRLALTAHVRVRELAIWPDVLAGLRQIAGQRGVAHATFQPEAATWEPVALPVKPPSRHA